MLGIGLGIQQSINTRLFYGPDLLLFGDFSAGDLDDFDEVGNGYSVNGSNQLVQDHDGGVNYLGKDFAFETDATYTVSYDVISSDYDGNFAFSGTSMFGGTGLPFTIGHHSVDKVAANGSSTMAFRIVLNGGTNGTQIVLDNFRVQKKL